MTTTLPPTIADGAVTQMPAWVVAALGGSGKYVGWCTVLDVQLEIVEVANRPDTFNNSNVVAQCITKAALELQGFLEPYYVMPYAGTDPYILGRLSHLNALLAASLLYALSFGGSAPDASTVAAELRAQVEAEVHSIILGEERWDLGGHDAQPQAELPAYPHAALALVSPNSGDQEAGQPIFSMTQLNYSRPAI